MEEHSNHINQHVADRNQTYKSGGKHRNTTYTNNVENIALTSNNLIGLVSTQPLTCNKHTVWKPLQAPYSFSSHMINHSTKHIHQQ